MINKTYAIIEKKRFICATANTSFLVLTQDQRKPIEFANKKEARAWIEDIDNQIYHFDHSELARPEYQIVEVGSVRFCAAYKRTFGGLEW